MRRALGRWAEHLRQALDPDRPLLRRTSFLTTIGANELLVLLAQELIAAKEINAARTEEAST